MRGAAPVSESRSNQENVKEVFKALYANASFKRLPLEPQRNRAKWVLKVGHIEVVVYKQQQSKIGPNNSFRTGPASTFSGCSGPPEVITVRRVVRQYGHQAGRARLRSGSATVAIRCSGQCFRGRFRMSEKGIMFT